MSSKLPKSARLYKILLVCGAALHFALLLIAGGKDRNLAQKQYELLKSGIDPDSDQIAYLMEDQLFVFLAALILVTIAASVIAIFAARSNLRWPWKSDVNWSGAFAATLVCTVAFILAWQVLVPVPVWTFS